MQDMMGLGVEETVVDADCRQGRTVEGCSLGRQRLEKERR